MDPAALEKLKRMTDFLDGLQQFSVRTQSIIEEMHFSGHRVDYDLAASVTVKRPNKLRAVRTGELMNQRFFYDGKTLTLYSPTEKVYATEPAPDTVEGMINFARETVGILLPSADLLYRNAYPLLIQDLTLAVVVGKTELDGVKCDHLLFSHPGADFQIWIAEGSQPWPRKYVVTDTDTPAIAEHHHVPERLEHRPCRGRCAVRVRAAQGCRGDPFPATPGNRRVRPLKPIGRRP